MRTTILGTATAALLAASLAFAPAAPHAADDRSRGDTGRAVAAEAAGRNGPTGAGGTITSADDMPVQCDDDADVTRQLAIDVDGQEARGAIAFPAETATGPRHLVVFAHGYGHSSHSWVGHMRWAAEELGAVVLAMDYRGTEQLPEDGEVGGTRGWQVREGAADSTAAARTVLVACPHIGTVTMFGVSMGANTAGLALAAQPTRPGSEQPLYDWWINVEGAANVVETYLGARSLAASGNEFAKNAMEDIEREVGGPIESDPQGYVDLAVVSHVEAIVASGVRGVFHVHGVEDGLVPYDQSRELHAGLAGASQGTFPQEFWTALRRDPDGPDPDEGQTNISDYAIGAVDESWESPFVGHGSEASADNDVMHFSFDRLRRLVVEDELIVDCFEGVYDATTRTTSGTACLGS